MKYLPVVIMKLNGLNVPKREKLYPCPEDKFRKSRTHRTEEFWESARHVFRRMDQLEKKKHGDGLILHNGHDLNPECNPITIWRSPVNQAPEKATVVGLQK